MFLAPKKPVVIWQKNFKPTKMFWRQNLVQLIYDFGAKENPLVIWQKNWYLIFVKRAVFVSGLSLLLKGNDDKTDEDIDHEEGNDNDVNEIKDSNDGTEVVDGSNVFSIGIDRNVKDARPAFKGGYHE